MLLFGLMSIDQLVRLLICTEVLVAGYSILNWKRMGLCDWKWLLMKIDGNLIRRKLEREKI